MQEIDNKTTLRHYYKCECKNYFPTLKDINLHSKVCNKFKSNIEKVIL